jgi:DNA-binding MarR family transcriptional regulator
MPPTSSTDYTALAHLRSEIRRFLAFSESAARAAGLEPQQHQLLLLLRSLPPDARPNIRTVAESLLLRHHSAVELAHRAELAGLVVRERSTTDKREVLLSITPRGETALAALTSTHREELRVVAPRLIANLQTLLGDIDP